MRKHSKKIVVTGHYTRLNKVKGLNLGDGSLRMVNLTFGPLRVGDRLKFHSFRLQS